MSLRFGFFSLNMGCIQRIRIFAIRGYCKEVIKHYSDRSSCFTPLLTLNLSLFYVHISHTKVEDVKVPRDHFPYKSISVCLCVNSELFHKKSKKINTIKKHRKHNAPPSHISCHQYKSPSMIPEQQGSATSLLMSRNLTGFLQWLYPAMLNAW